MITEWSLAKITFFCGLEISRWSPPQEKFNIETFFSWLDPVRKKVIKISSEISKPFDWFGLVLWCLMTLSTIFQLYHGTQFYWWGNRSTRRKPPTCSKLGIYSIKKPFHFRNKLCYIRNIQFPFKWLMGLVVAVVVW
jgi:hypothetical protein